MPDLIRIAGDNEDELAVCDWSDSGESPLVKLELTRDQWFAEIYLELEGADRLRNWLSAWLTEQGVKS